MNRANRFLVVGGVMCAVALVGMRVYADDANDIEQFYGSGAYVQWDNTAGDYPVVTAVGSQPGVFGGHTYTSWSVFAADASGSMDLFISQSQLTNMPGSHPTSIAVGDQLNMAGEWDPFHSLPELEFFTAPTSNNYFTTVATGITPPAAPVRNISQLTGSGMGVNYTPGDLSIAGYYLELDNVTISSPLNGLTALPSYTTTINNETFTITDNSGSMTFFDWTTSYSAATQLAGTPIGPDDTYDLKGFISYNGTLGPLEFTALQAVAVPEPSTIMLVGAGLLGLLTIRRRRS